MSRTAKRPNGGYSVNASTHNGLLGSKVTIEASPFLIDLGFSIIATDGTADFFQSPFLFYDQSFGKYPRIYKQCEPYDNQEQEHIHS